MHTVIAIATGGAIGAVLRHFLNLGIGNVIPGTFPWGIFTANILGSFILGVLVSVFAHVWVPPQSVKLFLTVGLLGAFTTFSTFSLHAVTLLERGAMGQALFYVFGSVSLAIVGLYIGMSVVRLFSGT